MDPALYQWFTLMVHQSLNSGICFSFFISILTVLGDFFRNMVVIFGIVFVNTQITSETLLHVECYSSVSKTLWVNQTPPLRQTNKITLEV